MNMELKYTKPFNAEHAKAGAPYCCRKGEEATVLKWDCRDISFPLAGVLGPNDESNQWGVDGVNNGGINPEYDLVMVRLGYINDNPVFVGDELEQRVKDGWVRHNVQAEWGRLAIDWENDFRWPVPESKYPQTTLSADQLYSIYAKEKADVDKVMAAVANTALRHACETQQVVPMGQVQEVARGLAEKDRAARDWKIAKVVLDDVHERIRAFGSISASDYIRAYPSDLTAIIAKVPA